MSNRIYPTVHVLRRKASGVLGALPLCLLMSGSVTAWAQPPDEPSPTFRAADILPPAAVSGPHFTVGEQVVTDGYLHAFTLTSDFGPFTALGRSVLDTRIDEIRAIAALQDVSRSAVFVKAAGGAVVDIGKGAARAVANPVDTAKGIGSGVKRLGVNLGRAGKRMVTEDEGADTGGSAAEGAANTVLGVSSAMRLWARKVGADPYTTNIVLREALKSVAQVDAAGSIAAKIAVPIPGLVGSAATVGDLVWSQDPEALRKFNEERLAGLRVSKPITAAFLKNGWFTLSLQTRIIAALSAVPVPGVTDYLATAAAAESERDALFFVESAEMLHRRHEASPVARLLPDSRAIVARVGGGAVVLAPVDYVRAAREYFDTLREIDARARKELGANAVTVHITGRASQRAREEASKLGWTIEEGAAAGR